MGVVYRAQNVERMLKRIERNAPLFMEDTLEQIGRALLKGVKANLNNRLLRRRTSGLYDSWDFRIESLGENRLRLIVGSDKPYSRIHDIGGRTGRNYATLIKATRYFSRVPVEKRSQINAIINRKLRQVTK